MPSPGDGRAVTFETSSRPRGIGVAVVSEAATRWRCKPARIAEPTAAPRCYRDNGRVVRQHRSHFDVSTFSPRHVNSTLTPLTGALFFTSQLHSCVISGPKTGQMNLPSPKNTTPSFLVPNEPSIKMEKT